MRACSDAQAGRRFVSIGRADRGLPSRRAVLVVDVAGGSRKGILPACTCCTRVERNLLICLV